MNQPSPYKSSYRSEIDGLRAFAVLSVVAFHAFPSWLKGGFIGVDVFFVISGFLITSHIFENLDEGQFSFTDFFSRRCRRIFPALILVMLCSLAFGWFALLADEFAQLGKHVASGATFINNFILVNESGYFDNAAKTKPMLHLWSLAVEVQFYIIWPLVLWLAWKRKFNLLSITILVALFSFYLNLRFVKSHPTEIFFWPGGRFWEFLSGSLLAWLLLYKSDVLGRFKQWVDKFIVRIIYSKEIKANGSVISNLMSFIGLLLLAYSVIRINESLSFPSKWALIPIIGTVLVIASGSKAWLNRIFLMNPIAIWFGLISYPFYLWHWPILSFLQIVEGEMAHRNARILAVLLSIFLAWFTYRFIERPIRFGGRKGVKSLVLIGLIAIVGSMGGVVNINDGITTFNQKLKYISDAKGDWDYPNGLIKRNGFYSTSEEDPTVLLVGDSHIEQYGPRVFEQYSQRNAAETAFMTGGGCPLIPNVKRDDYPHCDRLLEKMDAFLNIYPIKTIVIGVCFNCYLTKGDKNYYFKANDEIHNLSSEFGLSKAKNSFYDFVKRLSEKYEVIVLTDVPNDIRFHPNNILRASVNGKRQLPLSDQIISNPFDQNKDQIKLAKELDIFLSDFSIVVHQHEILCPNGICNPINSQGWPIYKDGDHMRPFFVKEFMDVLDQYILLSK